MRAEVFLDTNIFIYAFDPDSPAKQKAARQILSGCDWFISWQVVQEFSAVALRKFAVPIKAADLHEYLSLLLWPRCRVLPTETIYARAAEIAEQTGWSFYDSLIMASALAGGAKRLLT